MKFTMLIREIWGSNHIQNKWSLSLCKNLDNKCNNMGSCAWNRHLSKELWHSKYLKLCVLLWEYIGHSNVIFMNNFKIYYREGGVVFFFQVQAMWFWSKSMNQFWLYLHYHLHCLSYEINFIQRCSWKNKYHFVLVPFWGSHAFLCFNLRN
jgi:hypothetical protein